jgi:hypothetical protein
MIITLCGSTKFKKQFENVNAKLTMIGHIVISCGVWAHSDDIPLTKKQKDFLDKIHRQKIDLSDAIYVIDVDGYIGKSTKSEIIYAIGKGKKVLYMSEDYS